MTTPYVGEIMLFGGNFAVRGWAFCNGQILSIAQQSVLFALIGTTYGGDGQNTFALPNLNGRLAIGQGSGPGLTPRTIGEVGGTESVTLTIPQMGAHSHPLVVNSIDGTVDVPASTAMAARPKQANGGNSATLYTDPTKTPVAGDLKAMQANIVSSAGGNQSHDNMMPYLCINYEIALEGIFPSRN